eukprot:15374291-Alexandrium_andersonii.AAC.1
MPVEAVDLAVGEVLDVGVDVELHAGRVGALVGKLPPSLLLLERHREVRGCLQVKVGGARTSPWREYSRSSRSG